MSQRTPSGTVPIRIISAVLLTIFVVIVVVWVHGVHGMLSDPAYPGESFGNDFSVFWGAAKLANEGRWLAPFDTDVLTEARRLPPEDQNIGMFWFYPPVYLMLLWPLGKLPFFWAWLTFCAVSVVFFVVVLRGLARPVPGAIWFLVCGPITMLTLALGQNSLIFAALFVLALEAIRREQPVLAGLALAAMTLKPQLGVPIPFALAAAGYWRVILWACIFTGIMVLGTLVFPGAGYWVAFFEGISSGSGRLQQGDLETAMISTYGNAVSAGIAKATSLQIQLAVSIVALVAVSWLWRTSARFDVKAAGLCFALLLVTPYAIYYELMFALVGALYLARDGFGRTRVQALLMLSLWGAPILGVLTFPDPFYVFTAPLLALCLGVTMAMARQTRAP